MADIQSQLEAQQFIDDRSKTLTGDVSDPVLTAQIEKLKDPALPPAERKRILREIVKVLSPEDYAKIETLGQTEPLDKVGALKL